MHLVIKNLQQLDTFAEVIQQLSVQQYQEVAHLPHAPSVGRHIRHVLEHYEQLLAGLRSGVLDYAGRKRQQHIEQSPKCALNTLRAIQHELRKVASPYSFPLVYHSQHSRLASNLARELDFLHSHSVHHLAIIHIILFQSGVELDSAADLHPSTQEHQRECAQ